jgi:hypothetical protein
MCLLSSICINNMYVCYLILCTTKKVQKSNMTPHLLTLTSDSPTFHVKVLKAICDFSLFPFTNINYSLAFQTAVISLLIFLCTVSVLSIFIFL